MSRFLSLGLGASLLAHGAAYAALGSGVGSAPPRPVPSSVEFEVAVPKVSPPPPPVAEEPPPQPAEPEPRAIPRAAAPAALPLETAPKPVAAVDLSGLTLTNDSGDAAWTSPSGDGSARQGPLGPIGTSGKASRSPEPARLPVAAGPALPALVAAGDLSDKPRPPALDAALRRHYPAEARMRAISGSASLRVRIDPDGRVRSAALSSETFAGFGDACRRALIGSLWSPPRDKGGRAVATEIRYTCRFVVD